NNSAKLPEIWHIISVTDTYICYKTPIFKENRASIKKNVRHPQATENTCFVLMRLLACIILKVKVIAKYQRLCETLLPYRIAAETGRANRPGEPNIIMIRFNMIHFCVA
ncbi:MAG: hypothetical protein LC725_04685, partial [Lentisphaerae bacterium]|nr:hypothetical protein [Lentisphaerota bacterium]